ncbi:MAG TPA: hypothetical protein VGG71_12825, partial [Chitinophagaceae bacterium]
MRKSTIFITCFLLLFSFASAQSGTISSFDSYTAASPFRTYELHGSLLLFDKGWAHARVELPDNKVLNNDTLFFNYNKMEQTLLVTRDFRTMMTVEKDKFKSVTLFFGDSVFILEHVNLINSRDLFFELLRNDNKYSLYLNILTKFKDVNYRTDGLVSEGNSYADLINIPIYYIVFPNKQYKKLNSIDKKSILKAFSS